MKSGCLIVLSMLATATCASAMNGKAVTVIQTIVSPFWNPQPAIRSKLIVVSVSNTVVSRTDTILREPMLVHPTWSFDGTRIAFYRGGHGIAVMDANGGNLRDVWKGPAFGAETDNANISWPGADQGKWIYFHYGVGNGNGEIWKVNVEDTTQRLKVTDYIPGSQTCDACLRRWSLTPDAKYAVMHCYSNQNVVPHLWPPQGDNPKATAPTCVPTGDDNKQCKFWGDCNPALSPSGNILYHFAGSHTAIYANWWNHTPTSTSPNTITWNYTIGTGPENSLDMWKDIDGWLAPSAAKDAMACFIWPRGAVNSDKIVTSFVANRYGAEYWHNSCGGNDVVANWKDHKAVMVTSNPIPLIVNGQVPDGVTFLIAEPCHFFVTGGAAGCYEDINGNWIPVQGATQSVRQAVGRNSRLSSASQDRTAAFYDLKGVRIGVVGRSGSQVALASRLSQGAYIAVGQGASGASVELKHGSSR